MTMAEVKHTLRVEGGANIHFFDSRLMDQDDECLAFVDMHHPITSILAAAPDLFEAAAEFCRRVEAGEIRSKRSYAAFKAALSKATAQQEGR